jgi:pantoate--beta-alanine ligase
LETIIKIEELRRLRRSWEDARAQVAFVPTMGALHDGHLSLIAQAKKCAPKVIASIFVNPKQFGPNEDFAKYPRTLAEDLEKLKSVEADAVYLPNTSDIYPDHFQTYVNNRDMSQQLCGDSRPGHFDGVLTVVLKLFNLVRPNIALFGKKDYQQLRLIAAMVRDLNLDIEIRGCEIVREPDGLAMSSRNRYLSEDQRQIATQISIGLFAAKAAYEKGERNAEKLRAVFTKSVSATTGLVLEYAELRDQTNLKPFQAELDAPSVLLVAAKVGDTRLIDNVELA